MRRVLPRVLPRVLITLLALALLLVGGAVLGAGAALNTSSARDRIAQALGRATGHAARIDGRIGLAWSLAPAISAEGVALLNPPGFSRPELAGIRRLEARVALLPLLAGRLEIPSVTAEGADLRLERDASGRGNWLPPPAPPGTPAGPSRARQPVQIDQVRIQDAQVEWLGLPPLLLRSLSVAPSGGPVAGTAVVNGVAFDIGGDTKPPGPAGVPFALTASGAGLALAASGQAGGPEAAVALEASAPNLATLAPLAARPLPPLRNVVLTGTAGPAGLSGVKLVAGPSDLGTVLPGLRAQHIEATWPAPDQPLQLLAQITLRGLPAAVAVSVARGQPMPVAAIITADGGTLTVQGALGAAGLEGTVSGRVPDLQRAGALAGVALPALHDVAVDARVLPAPSGAGAVLRGLRFTSQQGDLAGDIAVTVAPRPSLRGSLQSQQLDADAWTSLPSLPSPPTAPAPAPAPTPASAPPPSWFIGDRPLPFALLRRADADLRASVGQITYKGAVYHAAELRLLLQDGRLQLDPAAVVAPGGPLQGRLEADAAATPPTASLLLRGSGLDAAGLAAAAGAPGAMAGVVDLDLDLRAAGATAHSMAATVTGHAALALTDGEIENAALATLLGPSLRGANIPFDAAGRSRVRCLAVRMEAAAGQATLQTLTLDAARLRIEGDGVLNLGGETMDLHLRPEVRVGPLPVKVPVHVTGPWRAPQAQVDKGVIAPGRFGISIGGPSADPCGPALAAARQGLTR